MKRKLIKQGLGGCTIYLPKKWIDKKGLKQGDEIDIIETETALVIGSPIKKKKEISLEITNENKHDLKHMITHAYRKGFNAITINNINSILLNEIEKITKDLLLGFELTEKSNKQCKIENISEPSDEKYDVLLRRIFLIIKETQNVILTDFENNKFQNFNEIEELRNQQDKFIIFCKIKF